MKGEPRARQADVPRLIDLAAKQNWRIEDDGNGAITLSSPVGKYGDWASIRITQRVKRIWLRTQRNYHTLGQADRGLWIALKTLGPEEQWRYAPDSNRT